MTIELTEQNYKKLMKNRLASLCEAMDYGATGSECQVSLNDVQEIMSAFKDTKDLHKLNKFFTGDTNSDFTDEPLNKFKNAHKINRAFSLHLTLNN